MSKKVAIMQPYFFPYIGYFQMVYNSSVFVVYDNVNYIQRGWINRNKIIAYGNEKMITLPVNKASLNTKINQVTLKKYSTWKNNFLRLIQDVYKKAPFFEETFNLIKQGLEYSGDNLSELLSKTLVHTLHYLDYTGEIVFSSELNIDIDGLDKEKKLEQILKEIGADVIILPSGSKELYENWNPTGVEKKTRKNIPFYYKGFKYKNYCGYSIIDVMMYTPKETIVAYLKSIEYYEDC